MPRAAKTPAMSPAIRASAEPTAAYRGRAGLVTGPRKLKAVAMPRSRRTTAACRIEGWKVWAKQKVMPTRWATSATCSGERSSRTPRDSSMSAEPDRLEEARLPCLTTTAPAAAMTIADIEEMLTVIARSPPVPTMSMVGPATSKRFACLSIISASPVISGTVSPLARRAVRKEASWGWLASPDMTRSMAQAACSVVRS